MYSFENGMKKYNIIRNCYYIICLVVPGVVRKPSIICRIYEFRCNTLPLKKNFKFVVDVVERYFHLSGKALRLIKFIVYKTGSKYFVSFLFIFSFPFHFLF